MQGPTERAAQLRAYLNVDRHNLALACDTLDAYLDAGSIADADAILDDLPDALKIEPGIRFRRARTDLMSARYAEAAMALRSLLQDGHESAALWHDLAFAQLCMRDTAAAASTLKEAATRVTPSAPLELVAARVALMQDDYPRAHAAIDDALRLEPGNATALGLRALALLDEGDGDAAASAAAVCLATWPDQHEALLAAGTAALWSHRPDEAQVYLDRGLERHPRSGRALSGRGQIQMLRGDLEGAAQYLHRAVQAMPDHVGSWHALAWVDLLSGEVDRAQASYERAYALDRNFADTHGGLALIHALRGQTELADVEIRKALRLNSACPTAIYARSVLLADAGQFEASQLLLAPLVGEALLPTGTTLSDFAQRLRSRMQARA